MGYSDVILFFCFGLLGITITDTLGAIASRKMNFKYSYLSIISIAIYTIVGYFTSKQFGLPMALLVNGILGLYDGTIGLWLSIVLEANNGLSKEERQNILGPKMAFMMLVFGVFFAVIGNFFS